MNHPVQALDVPITEQTAKGDAVELQDCCVPKSACRIDGKGL